MLKFDILKYEHQNLELYNKTFRLWNKVWSGFYKENESRHQLHSDPFLFNDEVCIISLNDDPVALFLMSYFDKNIEARLQSSYLHQYPDGLVDGVISSDEVKGICLYSNITVAREFRRNNPKLSVPLAVLQFALAILRYEQSGTDVLFGYCRNEKGINDLAKAHGGEVLATEERHQCIADFMVVPKNNIRESPIGEVKDLARMLWQDYLSREIQEQLYAQAS